MPMSPPACCFNDATYSARSFATKVEFGHSSPGRLELKTCFCVPLMKLANGSTSDVGQ